MFYYYYLNSVSLPGLSPEHANRETGTEAAEQEAHEAGLAQVVGVLAHHAARAASAEHA